MNKVIRIFVAGVPHRKPDLSKLTIGSKVSLVTEPENKFDANAIKVCYGAIHLGYVPKMETQNVKNLKATEATIVEIVPERKWSEIVLEVEGAV